MGVKGLNHFITRFEKTIMDRIDMREEIENWKIDHNGKAPTILIDMKEMPHVFVQRNEIGVILGGIYDAYNKMMKHFLENLQKTQAQLVFFIPGRKYTDDLPLFIPKREDDYLSHIVILDKIEEKCDLKEFLVEKNKVSSDVRMGIAFEYNLPKLVRRFGDIQVNYVRHNQEIALYAKQHSDDVLAVISNDTDFMAFEGDFQYWPANSINTKQMSGIRYCKHKLHDKIGLNTHQMQLLSALGGSNFLPYYIIEDWIKNLAAVNGLRGKIWNVSHYVKSQPLEIVNNKPKFDLDKISHDVFGPDYSTVQLNSIANCLACYDLDFKKESIVTDSFLKFSKIHNSFIYKLVMDDIFNVKDISYIDFRNCKSKNYAELTLPILMKLCGVLHKDDRRPPITRKVCMKHAHDEPFRLTEENIIYPPRKMKLPQLFDLIYKNKESKFDEFRWSLCEWILGLDEGFVKKVHDKKQSQYAAVIFTLMYLVQQGELTAKEANAILYSENKIRSLGTNPVDYPVPLNVHFIRIAHLYVKMYVLISHSLDICGIHEMTDLLRFNGSIFHKNMEKFEIATEPQRRVLLSTIEPIWIFE